MAGRKTRPLHVPGGIDPEAYAELTRESKIQHAEETIAHIRQIQRDVRGKDRRIKRAKFMWAVLCLHTEGFGQQETAEILGVTLEQVKYARMEARRDQTIDVLLGRLDEIALPIAVDNVIEGVMAGDRDYTFKVLDGRGVFRSHKSIEAQVKRTSLSMSVKLTRPEHLEAGAPLPVAKLGAIVGAPAPGTEGFGLPHRELLEGVVVEADRTSSRRPQDDDVE